MNIRKSTARRATVTAFLGAVALGAILAATSAEATRPTSVGARYIFRDVNVVTNRAQDRVVTRTEERAKDKAADDSEVFYIPTGSFQNYSGESPGVKEIRLSTADPQLIEERKPEKKPFLQRIGMRLRF